MAKSPGWDPVLLISQASLQSHCTLLDTDLHLRLSPSRRYTISPSPSSYLQCSPSSPNPGRWNTRVGLLMSVCLVFDVLSVPPDGSDSRDDHGLARDGRSTNNTRNARRRPLEVVQLSMEWREASRNGICRAGSPQGRGSRAIVDHRSVLDGSIGRRVRTSLLVECHLSLMLPWAGNVAYTTYMRSCGDQGSSWTSPSPSYSTTSFSLPTTPLRFRRPSSSGWSRVSALRARSSLPSSYVSSGR